MLQYEIKNINSSRNFKMPRVRHHKTNLEKEKNKATDEDAKDKSCGINRDKKDFTLETAEYWRLYANYLEILKRN